MKYCIRNKYIFTYFLIYCILFNNILSSSIISNKKYINNFSLYSLYNKNIFSKRKLEDEEDDFCNGIINDKDSFIPVKFFIDTINLEEVIRDSNINNYKNILIKSINNAANKIEEFITTYQLSQPTYSNEQISDFGITDWDKTIIGTGSGRNYFIMNYTNIVWFKLLPNTEIKNSIASSEIIINEGQCGRPQVGFIKLNEDINYSEYTSNYLDIIILQQLTHLLGFHKNFNNEIEDNPPFIGLIKKEEDSDEYYVDSENVINYAKKYFYCPSINKIPIKIDDNDLPHWPSRLLLGDYMADYIYPEEQVISGFTINFLKDLKYLDLKNSFTGGLMRYGKHQGCDFVNEKCIRYNADNSYENKYTNDFFYPTLDSDFTNSEPSCSSGRLSKTVHILQAYSDDKISNYKYFLSPYELYGGLEFADFCPVSQYENPSLNNIYAGRCSNEDNIQDEEKNIYGEIRSTNSFCALNTLVKKTSLGYDLDRVRAGCYNMYCSSQSLTIQVGEDYLVCPREGGKIKSDNYNGYILCPDYNLICTGIDENNSYDLCNDIFSCIENQIKENEASLDYEYNIKTTQDSSEYKNADFSTDFCELDEEGGKCPQYCKQCKNNRRCFECKSDYDLLGQNDQSTTEIISCETTTTLTNGQYYTKEVNSYTIYYPCMNKIEHCVKCSNANTCTECDEKYTVDNNNKCKEIVQNCDEYNADKSCKKCKVNYGLVKGEETSCILLTELSSQVSQKYYYTEGSDPEYYVKCSYKIENCEKCEGENNCIKCINNYGIIENDHSQCRDISSNEYYFDSTIQTYKLCSAKINNCKKCSQQNEIVDCIECDSNEYSLVHGDTVECILKTTILNDNSNNYFTDDDGINYYSCSDSFYHSVENCLKCNNKETCLSCKNGYLLLNSNNLCLSNSDLKKNKYVLINNVYKACSELMKGCETCTSGDKCTECNISYDLDINDKCIPTALSLTRYYKDPTTGKYISCEEITNCEECSSGTECTKCKSGYELDSTSTCIEKENDKDNDYDKIKALATGAIVLGVIATVVSITAIILLFFKNILFQKRNSNIVEPTDSVNNKNDEENEVVIQPSKRNIHNQAKNNDNSE